MLVRLVQPLNALQPILVTPMPITALFRLVQPKNALSPMLVTLSGITILVRLVQSLNAPSPIIVTPMPITTFFRLVQPQNALSPIRVTLAGIKILVMSVKFLKPLFAIVVTGLPEYVEGILTFSAVEAPRETEYAVSLINVNTSPSVLVTTARVPSVSKQFLQVFVSSPSVVSVGGVVKTHSQSCSKTEPCVKYCSEETASQFSQLYQLLAVKVQVTEVRNVLSFTVRTLNV
jgi:hypothetical protein